MNEKSKQRLDIFILEKESIASSSASDRHHGHDRDERSKGSDFSFTLPRYRRAAAAAIQSPSSSTTSSLASMREIGYQSLQRRQGGGSEEKGKKASKIPIRLWRPSR
jgi:hypothetical protein